ncbi:MAG: PilZ domain-containing protein [Gammaproteobacteria bacterium]|nr:PilZ domain-containing protein [Gammaproteobacteria bacterium]MDH3466989.1 PilZ domain-containing protein [Gammaproteobacteria bacterium]
MRMFIRHPSNAPIQITAHGSDERLDRRLSDLSIGGLCYRSSEFVEPDTLVTVRIALVRPPFEANARTVWCMQRDPEFDVGLAFLDATESYRLRMVEQICYIEHYRNEVRQQQGRILDSEQAAAEWISKYAADFPKLSC